MNKNEISYEKFLEAIKGISIVKATDQMGERLPPSLVKQMVSGTVAMLEYYRKGNGNSQYEKSVFSQMATQRLLQEHERG